MIFVMLGSILFIGALLALACSSSIVEAGDSGEALIVPIPKAPPMAVPIDPKVQALITQQKLALAYAKQQAIAQQWNQLQQAPWMQQGLGQQAVQQMATGAMIGAMPRSEFREITHEPVKDDGLVVGETVAWRCWRVIHGYLRSVAVDRVWVPGEKMEGKIVCDWGQAESGGVHAFKTMRQALEYGLPGAGPAALIALGRVKLHGLIIEHEKGYRAENAVVSHIEDVIGGPEHERAQIIEAIRKRYRCSFPPSEAKGLP